MDQITWVALAEYLIHSSISSYQIRTFISIIPLFGFLMCPHLTQHAPDVRLNGQTATSLRSILSLDGSVFSRRCCTDTIL